MPTKNSTINVIGLSGGKDSTALALRLNEVEPGDYIYLCTPTGDELPEMDRHWANLECILGQKLLRITPGYDFKGCCQKHKALPSWRMRFCTIDLKIKPCQKWISERAAEGNKVVLHVGLRADEEGREGGIYTDCDVRFPLREWSWGIDEVTGYLHDKGVTIPDRTDCARCFFQTLPEWWVLWNDHPAIYQDAVDQEVKAGHTFRSPGRDTWPASLAELRDEFERGRMPRGLELNDDLFGFRSNTCRVCSL